MACRTVSGVIITTNRADESGNHIDRILAKCRNIFKAKSKRECLQRQFVLELLYQPHRPYRRSPLKASIATNGKPI